MKCSYTVNQFIVEQDTYDYNTDGYNTFHEHITNVRREPITCIKVECAAWRDGRCWYKQD